MTEDSELINDVSVRSGWALPGSYTFWFKGSNGPKHWRIVFVRDPTDNDRITPKMEHI